MLKTKKKCHCLSSKSLYRKNKQTLVIGCFFLKKNIVSEIVTCEMVDARKQTETQTTTVGETKIPKRKKKSYFFPCCILSHSKTSTTYSKLLHKNIRKIKKMLLKKKILRLVFLISGFFFFFSSSFPLLQVLFQC